MKKIKISRSKIELFLNCPRCFWLDVKHKIERPKEFEGGYLGSKYDPHLKSYFDKLRKENSNLEELEKHNLKLYPDLDKIKIWRKSGVEFFHEDHGFVYYGKIDDLLVTHSGTLVPFDFKITTSNNFTLYPSEKRQLEIYGYLFYKRGFEVANFGIIYKIKVDINENFEKIEERKIFTQDLDYSPYDEILEKLKETYYSDKEPNPSQNCAFCKRDEQIRKLIN